MHNKSVLGEEQFRVLRVVQEVFNKDTIIAGGAVRDMIMDRPFRDVDIWIPHTIGTSWAKGIEVLIPQALQFGDDDYIDVKPTRNSLISRDGSENAPFVEIVHDMKYRGHEYQLIMTTVDPKQLVTDYFDFGFCKTWHNGKDLHITKDFEKDQSNKTLTYDVSTMDSANIKRLESVRGPKLLKKYPDFKLNKVGEEKPAKKTIIQLDADADLPRHVRLRHSVGAINREGGEIVEIALSDGWYNDPAVPVGDARLRARDWAVMRFFTRGAEIPIGWIWS